MGQTASSLFSTTNNEDALDALRAVDSAQLLAEVKRRNLDASDAREEKKSSHVVGSLRDKAADSDKREAELREALKKLGVDADSIEGGPPKKAFQTYVRPRAKDNAVGQTPENAAHQIAFLQRHELARRATHLRNTDPRRAPGGLTPHPVHIVRPTPGPPRTSAPSPAPRTAGASRPWSRCFAEPAVHLKIREDGSAPRPPWARGTNNTGDAFLPAEKVSWSGRSRRSTACVVYSAPLLP